MTPSYILVANRRRACGRHRKAFCHCESTSSGTQNAGSRIYLGSKLLQTITIRSKGSFLFFPHLNSRVIKTFWASAGRATMTISRIRSHTVYIFIHRQAMHSGVLLPDRKQKCVVCSFIMVCIMHHQKEETHLTP